MTLYNIILDELNNDTTTWMRLMEPDRIRVAKQIAKAVEHHDNINLLAMCANLRGVNNLQHRTIHEFSQFIDLVIKDAEDYGQYQFNINDTNAIRIWIQKFYEYCKKEYKY